MSSRYKTKPEPAATPDEITRRFAEYRKLAGASDALAERADREKQWLKAQAQEFGTEDDKGSRFVGLREAIDGFLSLKAEKRVRRDLDANMATSILKKKKLLKQCQKTVVMLDEDAVLALIFRGKISKAEEAAMYNETVSWAFVPNKKPVFDAAGD